MRYVFVKILKIWLIVGFLLSIIGCELDKPKVYAFSYVGTTMGTSFSIKSGYLPPEISIKQLQELITTRLNEINQRMSTYINDSELSKLNQAQTTDNQKVSPELFKVLKTSEEISTLSRGAFDITIAPLVDLWGFGPDVSSLKAPPTKDINALLVRSGYQKLQLNTVSLTLKKLLPELSMDLSALAKGYAVDEVALILEQQGIQDYLVEIGGELRLKGKNLQNKKWRIAIEKPNIQQRELQKVIAISDIAMATSGDYRNFFEQEGVRFSHTIDPRTGSPVTHKLASVTVLHSSSMYADAWATAFMVLGSEQAYKIAEQQKIAAFFIIKTEQGFAERATPLFTDYIEVKS
mgnify:CR=1 FL=1